MENKMTLNHHIYELIIIGAGPAGITAAIYATRKKMDLIVITQNIGGQVTISSQIENYMGFQYITGEELTTKFQEHLQKYKFVVKMDEVQQVEQEGQLFKVTTSDMIYQSKTVILATGRTPKKLKVPGEKEFLGRGVAYCATCDAPLFQDLDVAVIGGGNSGLEATLQLIKIAKNIHLIDLNSQLKADTILIDKVKGSKKVRIWTNTQVIEILGEKTVTGITVQRDGERMLLPIQGIFIEIGSIPTSDIVSFVEKNRWNEIIVNCNCETNIPGFFAAGDVTNAPEKQIVVAAGDGCKATLQAFRYLGKKNFSVD
jgi:alkyl hydroperoxide reductase subunit F